jgi:hypothetical protein
MEDGGEAFSFDNVIATCKPCHSRETCREVVARAQVAP